MKRDPIAALEGKLTNYPHVRHRRARGGLEIDAPNGCGFAIGFYPDGNAWVVGFGTGGFHESFESVEDALDFVAFGLSDACRLREVTTPFLRRAFVERREAQGWTGIYEVGTLSWPLSFGPRERVFQNTLIRA